eukprot:2137103-Alexandrium_andersonii.AAC.1
MAEGFALHGDLRGPREPQLSRPKWGRGVHARIELQGRSDPLFNACDMGTLCSGSRNSACSIERHERPSRNSACSIEMHEQSMSYAD